MLKNKKYIRNGGGLPPPLSAALTEIEETVELIHAEVEEADNLLQQRLALKDSTPTHLVLQHLLHQLLDCMRQVMAVDTLTVLLQTEDSQQLAVCATLGLEEEITQKIRIPIGRGFAGRIAASYELTIVDDLSTVEVVSPILRNKGLHSMLGVPLLVKDRVVGVFHVGTVRHRRFTRDDAHLLQLVANRIELVIDRLVISVAIAKHLALVKENTLTKSTNYNCHRTADCWLTCSLQKLGQTIRCHLHPSTAGFLELALPSLRLVSASC